jgi:hypothetical protein
MHLRRSSPTRQTPTAEDCEEVVFAASRFIEILKSHLTRFDGAGEFEKEATTLLGVVETYRWVLYGLSE